MDDVLKIALGIFIGSLAAVFTYEGIQTVRTEYALKQMKETISREAAKAEQAIRQHADQESAQQIQQQIEINAQQNARQEAAALAKKRTDDKAAAFKNFYKPSESCIRDAVQLDCANAYIKAKTVFESVYQPSR